MKPTDELVADWETRLVRLLEDTKASRVTLRLDWPERGIDVDDVIAEARGRGVKSMKGQTAIDQRRAPTVAWLERERRLLVQETLIEADPAPPRELILTYETTAQMLGPLVRHGEMIGWISVHFNKGPRNWQPEEIVCLEEAVLWFHTALAAMDPNTR